MAAPPNNQIFNVPNTITMIRLVLAMVVLVLLPWQLFETTLAALIVFIIAASTDWMDGYWARKYNQVTKLGRMLDPFVDKMIICGTYIVIAAEQLAAEQWFGITAWMAVVVMGREMLVTAIRSSMEQMGVDFSASWAGKVKMVLQCVAVVAGMICLIYAQKGWDVPMWLQATMIVSAWLALLSTIQSGAEYVFAAWKLTKS